MQLQGLSNRDLANQDLGQQVRGQGVHVAIPVISSRAYQRGKRGWTRPLAITAVAIVLSACSTMSDLGGANAAEQRPVQTAAAESPVQAQSISPTASKFGPTAVGQ